MNLLQRFEHWGDSHHPKWLDILRMALGIFLCYKGFDFLRNASVLISLMTLRSPFGSLLTILLAHYVVFAHIIGVILIAIGLFTRFACLIQIPVLIGALVFIHGSEDVWKPYAAILLTIFILLLLIFFLIVGNGPWSFRIADEEKRE
jgi:uncharacterized membrane protein YphA (DoxX/SURF4 family)